MTQRWVMEKATGTKKARTWTPIFCWYGGERQGADASARYFCGIQVRWHPIGEEFPCSYGGDPDAKYYPGEF